MMFNIDIKCYSLTGTSPKLKYTKLTPGTVTLKHSVTELCLALYAKFSSGRVIMGEWRISCSLIS